LLPKGERITRDREIKGILKRKKVHLSSPLLYVAGEENQGPCSRLAVACSSRLGGAVVRNRAKRVIMAAYSKISHKIAKNYDIVIVVRATGRRFNEYCEDLSKICEL
jgi:ribonuclease P protein component